LGSELPSVATDLLGQLAPRPPKVAPIFAWESGRGAARIRYAPLMGRMPIMGRGGESGPPPPGQQSALIPLSARPGAGVGEVQVGSAQT
jgi:hypothetical protein